MTTPLTAPMMAPQPSAASTPSQRLSVAFITVALSTPAKATTDPTDRSKSREARQNIIVHATTPIWETERANPSMFCKVKKYWTESDKATKRTRKIRIRLYSNKNASKRLQDEWVSRDARGSGTFERSFFVSDFIGPTRLAMQGSGRGSRKSPLGQAQQQFFRFAL